MLKRIFSLLKSEQTPTSIASHDSVIPPPETVKESLSLPATPAATQTHHERREPRQIDEDHFECEYDCAPEAIPEFESKQNKQNNQQPENPEDTETEINFCGLMLEQTISAHREQVQELRDVLSGKIPEAYSPEVVGAQDRCYLGKWLCNEAKPLARHAAYEDVVRAHCQFHQRAAEVVALHQQGEFAEAMLKLREVNACSKDVEASLTQLHEQAQLAKLEKGEELCS